MAMGCHPCEEWLDIPELAPCVGAVDRKDVAVPTAYGISCPPTQIARGNEVNDIVSTVRQVKTCFQSQYSLPTFQREYKWEAKHFIELLTDIQEAFRSQYDLAHGRKDVASYRPYFVGSIITSNEVGGKKPIIDGQQRLTSIFVLMSFLSRYCADNKITDIQDLRALLSRTSYGTADYSIEFSESRRTIFSTYLNESIPWSELAIQLETLPTLDEGDKRIVSALKSVESELDDDVKASLPFFIDYLVEKVTLIEIAVASENDAHRVFVTMNDRGVRLGPIDLLKGHVLSRITNEEDNKRCHEAWMQTVKALKSIEAEEDSLFFRAFFRARWAETMRDKKKKGEEPGDFENIADAYHRWFVDRATALGYQTSDDYIRFARDEVPKYAAIYAQIRRAELTFRSESEHIYYNAARKYTLQPTVLLATITPSDTEAVWRNKIILGAKLIDLILTSRSIEGKENNYDSLKDPSFVLTKKLRAKDPGALLTAVREEWDLNHQAVSKVAQMIYAKSDRTDILYVLARIAVYLEEQLGQTNSVGFETYWSRDRGQKTFDVEHVLRSNAADATSLGFASDGDYTTRRNLLGALVVLPRSRNRSLQDKSYGDKLAAYATENVLAQSLSPGFYESNPAVAELRAKFSEMSPIARFDQAALGARSALYTKVAAAVWTKP
jgi:hypothetical protein